MALKIKKKKEIINKINKIAKTALSAVIATSKNISVNKITELRKISRIENVFMCVIKNTLLKISLKKTHLECLNKIISGPIIIGFSLKNPESTAKIFNNFSKENKQFKIITAALNKKLLSKNEIEKLATLPNLKEALTHLIITIKNATIGKLFSILLAIKENNIKINTNVVN